MLGAPHGGERRLSTIGSALNKRFLVIHAWPFPTHDIRILLAGFSPPRCCFFLKVIDMQTRFLGASELAVSAIGLGCMGMSEFYGPSDDEVSLTVLHEAQALGVAS